MKLDTNALLKAAGIGAGGALVLALLRLIPFVGIVCCCLIWLGYAGIGVLYGMFVKQSGGAVNAGSFALGGAIGAAIAGFISGLVNGIYTLIAGTASYATALESMEQQGLDIPPEVYSLYTGPAIGVGGAFLSVCGAIIFGAILGAIGGAIYGATQKDSTPAAV
jgi:hypothetical protein